MVEGLRVLHGIHIYASTAGCNHVAVGDNRVGIKDIMSSNGSNVSGSGNAPFAFACFQLKGSDKRGGEGDSLTAPCETNGCTSKAVGTLACLCSQVEGTGQLEWIHNWSIGGLLLHLLEDP